MPILHVIASFVKHGPIGIVEPACARHDMKPWLVRILMPAFAQITSLLMHIGSHIDWH